MNALLAWSVPDRLRRPLKWVGYPAFALFCFVVSVWAILDVRDQVRYLIGLQRNLTWSRCLHVMVLKFVDLTEETKESRPPPELHEFTMLTRALEPNKTLDEVQAFANNEIVSLAKDLVAHGLAEYKPHMDGNVIEEIVRGWQNEKRAELLASIFREPKPWWHFGLGKSPS